jgi:cytochrome c peroxidase
MSMAVLSVKAWRILLAGTGWLAVFAASAVALAQDSGSVDTHDAAKAILPVQVRLLPELVGLVSLEDAAAPAEDRVELGRRLFFDPRLSSDGSMSCASCHQPDHAFSFPGPHPRGVHGRETRRHPPALINRNWGSVQFWDGRSASLQEQALKPIEDPEEMDTPLPVVLERLNADEEYRRLFANSFEDGVSVDNLAIALASFEKALVSHDSRVDRFISSSDTNTLSREERQGLWIFESKGGCWQCHSGPNYADEEFHNTGVSWGKEPLDLGRYEVTGEDADRGRFRTPTLRDVALSAPYMHDGSLATLRDVVEFYNRGGNVNPHLDERIRPLNLTAEELGFLEAFLKAMTGRHSWEE